MSSFPDPIGQDPAPQVSENADRPWQIHLYDSIWLLAGAAIVFFVMSYVVWGLVDILTLPAGG